MTENQLLKAWLTGKIFGLNFNDIHREKAPSNKIPAFENPQYRFLEEPTLLKLALK